MLFQNRKVMFNLVHEFKKKVSKNVFKRFFICYIISWEFQRNKLTNRILYVYEEEENKDGEERNKRKQKKKKKDKKKENDFIS